MSFILALLYYLHSKWLITHMKYSLIDILLHEGKQALAIILTKLSNILKAAWRLGYLRAGNSLFSSRAILQVSVTL